MKSRLMSALGLVALAVSVGFGTQGVFAQDIDAETYCKAQVESPEGYQSCMKSNFGIDVGYQSPTVSQPSATSTSTQQASQADVRKVDNQINAANAGQCEEDLKIAISECKDPTGFGQQEGENIVAVGTSVLAGGGMAAFGGKSTGEMCKFLKSAGIGLTGMNSTFSTKCYMAVKSCENSCQNAGEDGARVVKQCQSLAKEAQKLALAAAANLNSAAMFKACEDAATSGGPQLNVTGDTSKPDCTNPANYQNPACAHFYQQNPTGQGYVTSKGTEIGGDGGAGWEEGDPQQDPDYGGGQHRQAQQGFQQQGGGGMQGGTGELPNGGDEGQGGYGGGPNTDVLGGERGGGGGGSVARMGFEGGGSGGAVARKPNGSSFDLSKYLPQMKKDAKAMARAPAGLMRANTEIAPMTGNIFKNITDRMKSLCHQKRLMECN